MERNEAEYQMEIYKLQKENEFLRKQLQDCQELVITIKVLKQLFGIGRDDD